MEEYRPLMPQPKFKVGDNIRWNNINLKIVGIQKDATGWSIYKFGDARGEQSTEFIDYGIPQNQHQPAIEPATLIRNRRGGQSKTRRKSKRKKSKRRKSNHR
jgi:hypothetical protein